MSKIARTLLGMFFLLLLIVTESLITWWGYKESLPPAILIPLAGIIAFFGMLFVANVFSDDPAISHGEMRKAITASIIVVYFFVITLALFKGVSPSYFAQTAEETAEPPATETEPPITKEPTAAAEASPSPETDKATAGASTAECPINTPLQLVATIATSFTNLVGVVVGFYFVTRGAENITDKILKAKNPAYEGKEDE